jgi:Ca2+-binding RTX toxin-like protein
MANYTLTENDDLFEPFDPNNPWNAKSNVPNSINGLGGNDIIVTGSFNDTANGGAGNDLLFGLGGSDSLNGGAGDDILDGASGNDTLVGDDGLDTYLFEFTDSGASTVQDTDGILVIGSVAIGESNVDGFTLTGTAQPTTGGNYSFAQGGFTWNFRMDGTTLVLTQNGVAEATHSVRILNYQNGKFGITLNDGTTNPTPNVAPVANNDSATTTAGQAIAISVLANDTDSDGTVNATTVVAQTQPAHGTVAVNSATGVITYTPTANYNGSDSFTYKVKDDDGALSNAATVNVNVTAAPVTGSGSPIAASDTATTTKGTAVVVDVLANDRDTDGGTLNAGSVVIKEGPKNGTVAINNVTGAVTYTPNTNFVGADNFAYTVKDNDSKESNVATAGITVTGTSNPNTGSEPGTGTTGVNKTGTATANALAGGAGNDTLQGLGGNDLLYGYTGNDSLDGGAGNDVMGGAAGNDTMLGGDGDDQLNGGADNDSLSGGAGNDKIYAERGDDTVTGGAGTDTIYGWDGNDSINGNDDADYVTGDAGNDTIHGDAGNDTLWGSEGDDQVTGDDGNDFIGGDAGNDSIEGNAGNDTLFGWTGNDTINGGVGNDQLSGEAGADTYVFTGAYGNDTVYDDGGVLTIDGSTITGNATADATQAGTYHITIGGVAYDINWSGDRANTSSTAALTLHKAGDSANSITLADFKNGTYGITLAAAPNVAPVANTDFINTNENTPITVNVLTNDTDSDGTLDPKTVTIIQGPVHGTVAVDPNTGLITYTPTAGYDGHDGFSYTVKDNNGVVSNVAGASITVNNVNVAPVASNDVITTSQDQAVNFNLLTNDTDSDGTLDATSVTIVNGPDHGTLTVDATTGLVTYTPTANYSGSDDFTYTVKDNSGAVSNVATASISVSKVNVVARAEDDRGFNTHGEAITLDVVKNDSDTDGTLDASTLTIVDGPDNGTVTLQNGKFVYTANTGYVGSETFTYTVADNDGGVSNQATVSIAVKALNVGQVISVDGIEPADGTTGDDTITGFGESNILEGGAGDDKLIGGAGLDALSGSDGDDTLQGNGGDDALYGGAGIDHFIFAAHNGTDEIQDFVAGSDLIELQGFTGTFSSLITPALTQDGADAVLTLGDTVIRLVGVTTTSLHASDFIIG